MARARIVFEPPTTDSKWWVASIPDVTGAYSQGRTKNSARRNLIDALREIVKAGGSFAPRYVAAAKRALDQIDEAETTTSRHRR